MKYLVLLCDGMADYKIESLGYKTPMEKAYKPMMDSLCAMSVVGSVMNVPESMVPESDTANLAVLSYDPLVYSKGRSPLEALSMGLEMTPEQTAFRCNVLTLSEEEGIPYSERTMIDHSADEISTEEAKELIATIEKELGTQDKHFYPGVSYRHCLLWSGVENTPNFSRPHDIIGRKISEFLPKESKYLEMYEKSYDILLHHPINEARRKRGLKAANSIWLWSPGKKPALPSFKEKWGIDASVISAVDLIKGIAICAGMESIDVEGATGNYKTNYTGKANAAIDAFNRGKDLVYIHLEGPDECGHRAETENKITAIEKIDELILTPLLDHLRKSGEPFKIMVLPDHPTPISIRTHSHEAVPFFIYDSKTEQKGCTVFSEENAQKSGLYLPRGEMLFDLMIGKK